MERQGSHIKILDYLQSFTGGGESGAFSRYQEPDFTRQSVDDNGYVMMLDDEKEPKHFQMVKLDYSQQNNNHGDEEMYS